MKSLALSLKSVVRLATAVLAVPSLLSAQSTPPGILQSVVYRNAPFIMQETENGQYPQAYDQIVGVDFDGDRVGTNNATHASDGSVPYALPKVYYSVVETGATSDRGYYFIGYYWYHVNDGGQSVGGLPRPGHEHDLEGAWMVVKKTAVNPYGVLVASLTQAHGALIPAYNGNQSAVAQSGIPGGWYGYSRFWLDQRYSVRRPVIAVRSMTHGSYVPAPVTTCDPRALVPYHIGIFENSVETYGSFMSCTHNGTLQILYSPMMEEALTPSTGLPVAQPIPGGYRAGGVLYALEELSQSALWQERGPSSNLFTGDLLTLLGGTTGLNFFAGQSGVLEANPPWQWQGGSGEGVAGQRWYDFEFDNTAQTRNAIDWPQVPYGALLGGARDLMWARFPYFPEIADSYRYSPYVVSPPDYSAPPQLAVSLQGPNFVDYGETPTWSASATGGTGPYVYQWSGLASGSGASITFAPNQSGDLYLDVWDAAGAHIASNIYVTYNACPDHQISC